MLKHTVSIMDPYVSKLDLKRVKYCFLANYIMPREKLFFFSFGDLYSAFTFYAEKFEAYFVTF